MSEKEKRFDAQVQNEHAVFTVRGIHFLTVAKIRNTFFSMMPAEDLTQAEKMLKE